jgi:hypothetical protein
MFPFCGMFNAMSFLCIHSFYLGSKPLAFRGCRPVGVFIRHHRFSLIVGGAFTGRGVARFVLTYGSLRSVGEDVFPLSYKGV